MKNEIIEQIGNKVNKVGRSFNKERWIWIVLVSGISTVWITYNRNVEKQLANYREDAKTERNEVKAKDSIISVQSIEIAKLNRSINSDDKKLKK